MMSINTSVLAFIDGPKCVPVTSMLQLVSQFQYLGAKIKQTDRQTDRQTPDQFTMLTTMDTASMISTTQYNAVVWYLWVISLELT